MRRHFKNIFVRTNVCLCVVFPIAVTSGPAVCVTFSGVCLSMDRCASFVCFLLEDYSADRLCPRVSGSRNSV